MPTTGGMILVYVGIFVATFIIYLLLKLLYRKFFKIGSALLAQAIVNGLLFLIAFFMIYGLTMFFDRL